MSLKRTNSELIGKERLSIELWMTTDCHWSPNQKKTLSSRIMISSRPSCQQGAGIIDDSAPSPIPTGPFQLLHLRISNKSFPHAYKSKQLSKVHSIHIVNSYCSHGCGCEVKRYTRIVMKIGSVSNVLPEMSILRIMLYFLPRSMSTSGLSWQISGPSDRRHYGALWESGKCSYLCKFLV